MKLESLSRYTNPCGEPLQTLLDWSFVSPKRNWLGPIEELATGGSTESALQLGWEKQHKALVMTVTNPENPQEVLRFVHSGGSGGIFTLFANAQRYAEQRRAINLVSFTLYTEEAARMRELVEEFNSREAREEGEFTDLEEEESNRLAAFYDEHPDQAPHWWNEGPDLAIVEEKELGGGLFTVEVWVKDVSTAMVLQQWWQERKNGQSEQKREEE